MKRPRYCFYVLNCFAVLVILTVMGSVKFRKSMLKNAQYGVDPREISDNTEIGYNNKTESLEILEGKANGVGSVSVKADAVHADIFAKNKIQPDEEFSEYIGISVDDIIEEYKKDSISVSDENRTAFYEVFNSSNILPSKIYDIVRKATEEEKVWICNKIIERFYSDSNAKVRRACLLSLASFPNECRELVKEALSDEDVNLRITASILTQKPFFTEEDLEPIYQAAKKDIDGRGTIVRNCIQSMGYIGGEKASSLMIQLLEDENYPFRFKPDLLIFLGFTNTSTSFEVLKSVVDGQDKINYPAAIEGLKIMSSLRAPHLSIQNDGKAISDPEMYRKIKSALVRHMESDDSNIRLSIASGFGDFGEMKDISLLEPLLSDEYFEVENIIENGTSEERKIYPVRDEAIRAIAKINARNVIAGMDF